MSRIYSLEGNCLELVSEWDAVVEWADLCLPPYITIGETQRRIAKFVCHYGEASPILNAVRPQDVELNLHRPAEAHVIHQNHIRTSDGVDYQFADGIIETFYPERNEDSLRDPERLCREVLFNCLPIDYWFS